MSDITRREFFRQSMLISAGLVLLSCEDEDQDLENEDESPGMLLGNQPTKNVVIVCLILAFIGVAINPEGDKRLGISNIYTLGILIPSFAVGARRMHDVGKSGWFQLIPIYNIILFVTEGDKGDNQYGLFSFALLIASSASAALV